MGKSNQHLDEVTLQISMDGDNEDEAMSSNISKHPNADNTTLQILISDSQFIGKPNYNYNSFEQSGKS